MPAYPLTFTVAAESEPGIASGWNSSSNESPAPLALAIPHEFDGPGNAWSPEGLFASSLLNCFVATFKVIAQMSKFDYAGIRAEIAIQVEPDAERKLWVPRAHLKAWVKSPANAEKALMLMDKASKTCLVMNSVKTEKTTEFLVE